MKKSILFLTCLLPALTLAAQTSSKVQLEKTKINPSDHAAIIRGGKLFKSNCLSCHALRYSAHNARLKSMGITLNKMPLKIQQWWLGIAPPDLSLVIARRGSNWVYTYLHAFYLDPSRPTGFNNLLVHNTVMMNVLAPFQGKQILTNTGKRFLTSKDTKSEPYYAILEMQDQGSMTPTAYHQMIYDIVSFLAYVSEPTKEKRVKMGKWVLAYLGVFLLLAMLLKKAFWSDIKQKK